MRMKKITGKEFKSHDKTSKENSSMCFFPSILIESVWKANFNFKRSNRRKQKKKKKKKNHPENKVVNSFGEQFGNSYKNIKVCITIGSTIPCQ